MAYSWEDSVNGILKQKKIWNDATYEKDTETANGAAEASKAYYQALRDNGDEDLANTLEGMDYAKAKSYLDSYIKNRNMVNGPSYQRSNAIGAVIGQKKAWNDSTYAKDTAGAGRAAKDAEKLYNWMRDNGDAKTAEALSGMDYDSAKKYGDFEVMKQNVVDGYTTQGAVDLVNTLRKKISVAQEEGDAKTVNDLTWELNRFYKMMEDNGDGLVRSNLEDRSDADAVQYGKDYAAKHNKTALRNYAYKMGAQYGLSTADIDKLFSYDNATGEITFAGENIGRPDAVVGGVSYVDTEKAEKLVSDAFERMGYNLSGDALYDRQESVIARETNALAEETKRQNANVEEKWNELWAEGKKNITDSKDYNKIYDRVMSQYNLAALQGRDNQAAYGAAANGGNIDSYAAANALRQQAALTAMGQQTANEQGMAAYQTRMNNLNTIFDKLGIEYSRANDETRQNINQMQDANQQVFDNSETRKNNEVDRDLKIAGMTGYVDDKYTIKNNLYFDKSGNLINPETDYQQIINNAREKLKTETDPVEQERLRKTINDAMQAKAVKIMQNPEKYGQYAHEVEAVLPQATMERYSVDSAERIANGQATAAALGAQAEAEAENTKAVMDYNARLYEAEAENTKAVMDYNAKKYAADKEYDAKIYEADAETKKEEKEKNSKVSDSVLQTHIKKFDEYATSVGDTNAIEVSGTESKPVYNAKKEYMEYITYQLLSDKSLTDDQVDYIMSSLGIPTSYKETVLNDKHYK